MWIYKEHPADRLLTQSATDVARVLRSRIAPQITVSEFVAIVKKSGLLDSKAISALTSPIATEGDAKSLDTIANVAIRKQLLTLWQIERLAAGRYKGFFVEDYVLIDYCARGRTGDVLLGRHTVDGSLVVIKAHPSGSSESRFGQELRFTQRAYPESPTSPRIVHAPGVHYFIRPYWNGVTLDRILEYWRTLPIELSAWLIRQSALSLAAMHDRGLVHRDVRTSKIVLSLNGPIKVLPTAFGEGGSCDGHNPWLDLLPTDEFVPSGTSDYEALGKILALAFLGPTRLHTAGNGDAIEAKLSQLLMPFDSRKSATILGIYRRLVDKRKPWATMRDIANEIDVWLTEYLDEGV